MQKHLTLPKPSCCLCPYPNSRENYSGTLSSQLWEHSPQLREHFPQLRERSPQLRERSPQLRERFPQLREHFPQLREHFPQLREHFPQLWERFPQLTGNKPQVLNDANFYTITSLHRRGSGLKDSYANSINFIKYYV